MPLVYVAALTLGGVSCLGLAVLGSEHVRTAALRATFDGDRAAIDGFVSSSLTMDDLREPSLSAVRRPTLDARLATAARTHGWYRATVFTPTGLVLAGDQIPASVSEDVQRVARSGIPDSALDEAGTLTETIPIVVEGEVRAVARIVRGATAILAAAEATRRDLIAVALGAVSVLGLLLHQIYRSAGARLRDQAEALAESRRRDPLTGLINHGAAVSTLAEVLAAASKDGEAVGIALVDIDNFRLLNDTYGSAAGDEALSIVGRALRVEAEPWLSVARFGPDEFLAIAPSKVARQLPAAMGRIQDALRQASLEFDGSERLPLTVSAGVTYFPFHASGVNELLSAATVALGEAKAGGGDRTVVADAWANEPKKSQTSFDVLQGLVTAIDNKDRYTKRHSEDVATYALFLATKAGLEEAHLPALRTAGLLHDIGKIGIPDDILRKPGRLTSYEYEIVKQHVALGDLIIRDLPEIDVVRAGVRYHHERWDGQGYLAGLAGVAIPVIARVLAVCDAFSAMTTTRPYRKALSVDQALDELRASAGTQLDPALVAAFVEGIEDDPDAPLPGAERTEIQLWTPTTRAA